MPYNITGSIMDLHEAVRKWKRYFENYFTYKRAVVAVLLLLVFLLYFGPSLGRWILDPGKRAEDVKGKCLDNLLLNYEADAEEFNAHIHFDADDMKFLPYVGNGIFGLEIRPESPLYVRSGRSLSLPVNYHPIVNVLSPDTDSKVATVVHYLTGTAYKFQCFDSGISVSSEFMAHRTMPAVLIQNIRISNPTNENIMVQLQQLRVTDWPTAVSEITTFSHGSDDQFQVTTGMIDINTSNDNDKTGVMAVSVVSKKMQTSIEVKAKSSRTLECLTAVNYSNPITKREYATQKDVVETIAKEHMQKAVSKIPRNFKEDHIKVWQQLWRTGITISYSHAAKSLNGDLINATMYYVLSQVTSPYYEEGTTKERKSQLANALFYAEGCFGGHHTLQADSLWRELRTVTEINTAVSCWLLTLKSWGCDNLLEAGASGVVQAMVLSMGGFRFNKQHLELNIDPKYLHRDYLFRRISYGNLTHVNVSVEVQEDNKAVLFVALDRSDKYYYACDAGCLDSPIQLGPSRKAFPVKLTDPVTAILYITYDRQHMEELRHTIHVKEVVEAPAHEHHVITLHRHGHHLGGIPTFLWIVIVVLIVLFHLFLFKLIYNESCGSQDKYRTRYGKL